MASKTQSTRFTGKHMAMVLVGGFSVVVAVNFYMASLAVGGFHGIVVDNSYVASQQFNSWLDEAKADQALGWQARAQRQPSGHIVVQTSAVPEGAVLTAELRRPIGAHEFASVAFAAQGEGEFISLSQVPAGRWSMRLTITADGEQWLQESEI